jgi:lipase (class 3)
LITHKQIVDIVAELYSDDPQGFDDLLWPESDDGVMAGLKRIDDTDLVIFRGSVTIQDWARDLYTIPHGTINHPQLGDIHAGFMLGMDIAYAHFAPLLRSQVIVTGHSLGAGRASLFTALLVASGGNQDVSTVVFGEPRSGCGTLKTLLRRIEYTSYRNADPSGAGHDVVTDVPTDPPFTHNRTLTDVFAAPAPDDPWLMFRYHHIGLYQQALA